MFEEEAGRQEAGSKIRSYLFLASYTPVSCI
jgi:hypothetical protein